MNQDQGFRARLRIISPLDWLMLALALISIGLLGWETWGPVTPEESRDILRADYVICGIFLLEFLYRWRGAGWKREFVWQNWYEVLGMIPIAHPAIRGFRLFRVIRIVLLLIRFSRAADRAFGEGFTFQIVSRFKNSIVQAISRPVTVAVLSEVAEVLKRGHYTRNIARALEENDSELRAMVVEKMRADPQLKRFARLPFYGAMVETATATTLRVVHEFLEDPRTDELVADMLRENIDQIRDAVRENKEPIAAGTRDT